MTFAVNLEKLIDVRTDFVLVGKKCVSKRCTSAPCVLKEPNRKENLPLCGFPFGSVDHLPAFLPELELSLPSGWVEHLKSMQQ